MNVLKLLKKPLSLRLYCIICIFISKDFITKISFFKIIQDKYFQKFKLSLKSLINNSSN